MYTKKQKVEVHIIFLLITLTVEVFSFFLCRKGVISMYAYHARPSWIMPLHWLLPIWTILFALIAISGARVWVKRHSLVRRFALSAWLTQIILNLIWPITFFYLDLSIITPIVITLLFMTIIVLMFYTFLLDRIAGFLLIPYSLIVIYKLIFHWIFYILDINLVS